MSIRYTERLAEAGIEPSVGSVGDSYDNALAESVIGLFKTEIIHRLRRLRKFASVQNPFPTACHLQDRDTYKQTRAAALAK